MMNKNLIAFVKVLMLIPEDPCRQGQWGGFVIAVPNSVVASMCALFTRNDNVTILPALQPPTVGEAEVCTADTQ